MSAEQLLDPANLLAEARRETGLSTFDGPGIDEPLARLTGALRAEANLNEVGVHTWRARLLNTLITRLRARTGSTVIRRSWRSSCRHRW